MTRHQIILSLALLGTVLGSAACNHGTRPQTFKPAITPAGATVWLRRAGELRDRTGELFAVDSLGVMVLSGRLMRIRWDQLQRMDVQGLGAAYDIAQPGSKDAAHRARLALVSRFPQGLSGALLERVLASLEQTSLDGEATPPIEDLAAAAATASARFIDRREAIAAGYRRIGTDFPAMGEHWLLGSALLDGAVDPARPTMLTYVSVAGRPVLVGTGYVMSTRGAEQPRGVPGWPAEWHEHSGLVAEESGSHPATASHAHHAGAPDDTRTRVWVLHIWSGAENPAGKYRAENWALPFMRAGLGSTEAPTEAAGRALSLTAGGEAFLRALLTDAGVRTERNGREVDALIETARLRAAAVADRARADGRADEQTVGELGAIWQALTEELVRAAGPAVTQHLGAAPPTR